MDVEQLVSVAIPTVSKRAKIVFSVGTSGLLLLLLVSLILMSNATQDSQRFSHLYYPLLLLNTLGLAILIVLISINIRRLVKQLRARQPGSRLTLRMLALFVALAVTPVLVVYGFSLYFVRSGIDSWFDVRIEKVLDDSLELSRAALDLRMRELLRSTENLAEETLDSSSEPVTPLDLDALRGAGTTIVQNLGNNALLNLDEMRNRLGAEELTLLTNKGRIIRTSSTDAGIVPHRPSETVLLQLKQGRNYIGLDPIRDAGLYVRVVVKLPSLEVGAKPRILQALYPIAERMNDLADSIQIAYTKYSKLSYLRDQLKLSFAMTLTLVLAFSLLATIWAALHSARRMVQPIRDLAEGTRAVARGEYNKQLPVQTQDDLGFLVESFNRMSRRIAIAQAQIKKSHELADEGRAYLEAVLSQLSSGVLTFDSNRSLRTINRAAGQILSVDLESQLGESLTTIRYSGHTVLEAFFGPIQTHLARPVRDWSEEVTVFGVNGRQVLMCRGTTLTDPMGEHSGHVIVFDDITQMIKGQRDAAWSEVARRLAHEIKNPLTPIQLSAERLRHKYANLLSDEDNDTLQRLTNTIIQQVEIMKEMVNAFSDYAKPPQIQPGHLDLNQLVTEVLDLYRSMAPDATVVTQLDPGLPTIEADQARLRQVVNNVIKNALEATSEGHPARITVATASKRASGENFVELRVTDRGRGIRKDILDTIFEPYVTTKPKGTGLGLAIVKKIIEEHNGIVWMDNNPEGGASVIIRVPIAIDQSQTQHQASREAV